MEMVMIGLLMLAMVMLAVTFAYATWLGTNAHGAGIGRISFYSLATLKLWVELVLVYFLINSYSGLFNDMRVGIRIALALYLVVQSTAVFVALERWRREPYAAKP